MTNTETELPEMPIGWEWAEGEVSDNYYSYWFGTEYYMGGKLAGKDGLGGYSGEVFWDKGNKHTVDIRPVVRMRGDDPVYGYPVAAETFETEEEALNAVPEMIREL